MATGQKPALSKLRAVLRALPSSVAGGLGGWVDVDAGVADC
jgi:hypothetical protein